MKNFIPMIKNNPEFYRMMLGDFEVTALYDGFTKYFPSIDKFGNFKICYNSVGDFRENY